jgi:hypothetical protein
MIKHLWGQSTHMSKHTLQGGEFSRRTPCPWPWIQGQTLAPHFPHEQLQLTGLNGLLEWWQVKRKSLDWHCLPPPPPYTINGGHSTHTTYTYIHHTHSIHYSCTLILHTPVISPHSQTTHPAYTPHTPYHGSHTQPHAYPFIAEIQRSEL